jgi:hypothetical protein
MPAARHSSAELSAASASVKIGRNFWKIFTLKFLGGFFLLAGAPMLGLMLRHCQEG